MQKNFKILLIILFLGSVEVHSQTSGVVMWLEDPDTNYINMGPCFVDDSLKTLFYVENTGTIDLKIGDVAPSFVIGASPNDPDKNLFREFDGPLNINLPFNLPTENSQIIEIGYHTVDTSAVPYRSGRKEAKFDLGLLNANSNDDDIVALRSFLLSAYKTPYYIWGYETEVSFDSVYVDPIPAREVIWKVKSTWKDNIKIDSQEVDYLSPITNKSEFSYTEFDTDPVFVKKYQTIDWTLKYAPVNRGTDSAILKLYYKPDPNTFPDSVDCAWVKMIGTGVQQELQIQAADHDFSGDTVYLGNVRLGSSNIINLEIKNTGNIPFGVKSQSVLQDFENIEDSNFTIIKELNNISHIQPEAIADAILEFIPQSRGIFVSRYFVQSDISERKVSGVPFSKRSKTIYIKGNVIAPRINIPVDTIDFGNVIVNSIDCPSTSDTTVFIGNIGSDILRINSIELEPESDFSVNKRLLEIEPGADSSLIISFNTAGNDARKYEADLLIISEYAGKFDTNYIHLKANGVPPVTGNLFIPNISAIPGRIIEMPIILEGAEEHQAPAGFAKSFNTEITYDKTLLRYRNRSSIGTAMEGAVIDIQNSDPGKLFINVDNIGDYFAAKDTLLKLYFDTYLGESISTPVSFVESQTRLSDDNCLNAINLNGKIVSGRFTLDSICGLEYKAVPRNGSKIAVEGLYPNPAENSVVISCNIPFKIRSKIKIINSFGMVTAELFDEELPAGKYDLSFNLGEFPSGAYSVVFEAGLYLQRIPLMIQK